MAQGKEGGREWQDSCDAAGGSKALASAFLGISAALLPHGPSPLSYGSLMALVTPALGPSPSAFSLHDSPSSS